MRDCGSIPHEDPALGKLIDSIFFKKILIYLFKNIYS